MAVTQSSSSKNYDAFKRRIHKPTERRLNFQIYGRYKKGKTHFCTTAPNVLILDPEGGTDHFKTASPDVVTITQWADFAEVYEYLKYGTHSYEYVAFDGMTKFANMALRFIKSQSAEHKLTAKPEQKRINEYGDAGQLMQGVLNNFHSLPLGKIYTCQERSVDASVVEEDDEVPVPGKEDRIFVPDLPNGTRSAVNAIVDVIGRAYTVRKEHPQDFEKKITSYRLWLAQSVNYDTGTRSEFQRKLPDYVINPSVTKLTNLIETGSANA